MILQEGYVVFMVDHPSVAVELKVARPTVYPFGLDVGCDIFHPKGGFPVMAEITRILAENIRGQFFFVIATAASTRRLTQNFQLICCSQQVNATSQYNDSGSSRCSKWPNDRMVAVVKHFWLFVLGRRSCIER